MLTSVGNCRYRVYMSAKTTGPLIRIRVFRESHGLSVNELVQRIKDAGYEGNLHPDTIRNVELGHKPGTKRLMVPWALALGLKPMDLLPGHIIPAVEDVA
jgi:hypothetical protein